MDAPVIPDPPEPATTDVPPLSKSLRSKTIPVDLETIGSSGRSNGRSSVDSASDRPWSQTGEGEAPKTSSLSKLLASRKKRKKKKDKLIDELPTTLESESNDGLPNASQNSRNRASSTSLLPSESNSPQDDGSNLLTDDSEPDRTPPLTSHDSHSGFYTSSSPLIKATSADGNDTDAAHGDAESAISGTTSDRRSSNPDEIMRPATQPTPSGLSVPADRSNKKRSVSKSQRFKNAFSTDKKSNRDRASSTASGESSWSVSRRSSVSSKLASGNPADTPPPVPSLPKPIRTDLTEERVRGAPERPRLQTPPHTAIPFPSTTVTPPTPHLEHAPLVGTTSLTESPSSIKSGDLPPGVVVSPSGNMISHRRVRSASSANPKPSKLSNSIAASPILEEGKSGTTQSGFFSSVFSVAQTAASTLTNSLNTQKARSPAMPEAKESESQQSTDLAQDSEEARGSSEEKKPMAVDTLGSGDLNFSHLDIAIPPGGSISTPDGVVITKPDVAPEKRRSPTVSQRDEAAAKLEDRGVARAVTMAYEKGENQTSQPADDASDTLAGSGVLKEPTGTQTPSGGSTFDGEPGSRPFRSSSVRSRLARRRHRGSSGATSSTIGAIGASAIALGVPGANSSLPRLTGFAVASKKRNRDFHQLFRSVPEDDYLIEDYSCALQREIILAGRIYISEGHICFSSNILGWVTTLVISFDEVVAIEKESTAMVFPNAIAIQTLHARHTFRSLLSRESTYDLMVNIWKINHPTLKSSVNGTRVTDSTGDKTEKAGESEDESDEEEDEIYDEDEDEDNADSFFDAGGDSVNGSSASLPLKSLVRQGSGTIPTLASNLGPNGDADGAFPGPPTHAQTQYDGSDGQYDRVIKDETIPAPLGKVYSYIFGPASVTFVPKFLVDNQKSGELDFNCDKTGLTNENRTRKYSYIKPLNGSIGPKQTKCISTEQLDFLDLEKAVLVTLSTQTPDVPSGNVFTTKTKYLFTWAANNQTRFLMTCTIEWSGKSWLKGPIEKGAIDGQGSFGTDLIAALKTAIAPRARASTKTGAKGKSRRKRGDTVNGDAAAAVAKAVTDANAQIAESWGVFEPLRGILGPVPGIFSPLWNGNIAVLVIGILLFMLFFRGPSQSSSDMGFPGHTSPQRLAAYEEMWRKEESELWNWLEDRVGVDGLAIPTMNRQYEPRMPPSKRRSQSERELKDSLSEENLSDREMDHAIRSTRERLDTLERILSKRKSQTLEKTESSRQEL
ncbi:GRAM and VASt domain-containing protein [Aspergillus undulatus]|uniref:GRAM and VASt domain-containing protein n=1 Tax=Aspergillus undulatus TaxID=1810928 RepID=UPI003CCCF8EB